MSIARLNILEETRFEKVPVAIYTDEMEASIQVVKRIAAVINENDSVGKKTVWVWPLVHPR